MKTVPPDAVTPVQMIWHGVEVSILGYRGVKSRIEYGDLRCRLAEDLAQCLNAAEVVGIVQRRQIDAVLDPLKHFIVDDDGLLEQLSAMYDAMADRVDVSQAPNLLDSGAIRCEPAQHIIECRGDVPNRRSQLLPGTGVALHGDDRFATDPLHLPSAQQLIAIHFDSLEVCGNNLELQTGASGIYDEDIHRLMGRGITPDRTITQR